MSLKIKTHDDFINHIEGWTEFGELLFIAAPHIVVIADWIEVNGSSNLYVKTYEPIGLINEDDCTYDTFSGRQFLTIDVYADQVVGLEEALKKLM